MVISSPGFANCGVIATMVLRLNVENEKKRIEPSARFITRKKRQKRISGYFLIKYEKGLLINAYIILILYILKAVML